MQSLTRQDLTKARKSAAKNSEGKMGGCVRVDVVQYTWGSQRARQHGLYGSRRWYCLSGGGVGREDQVKVKRY